VAEPLQPSLFSADAEPVRRDLLAWFAANRRDLPWRRHRSLYGTWISEMMLQQTTIATVVPYWERFLARFPDVETLAAASESEVLSHWSGLGYYRRARQLHAASRLLMAETGGALPADYEGWRRLPGVGPYAAGAIASIGLGLPEPAVDANVRRVLGRWLGAVDLAPAREQALIADFARRLVPPLEPGTWNEALMELGALVCSPKQPSCGACPVRLHCAAGQGRSPLGAAGAATRAGSEPVAVVLVACLAGGHLWLESAGGPALDVPGAPPAARADFSRLHVGLLTLPMSAWYPLPGGTAAQQVAVAGLTKALARHLAALPAIDPVPAGATGPGGNFRHAITRFRLHVTTLAVRLPDAAVDGGSPLPGRPPGRWVSLAEADALHVSQLTRKALRSLGDGRG
jgi:A/G-specific adenine glycosylase